MAVWAELRPLRERKVYRSTLGGKMGANEGSGNGSLKSAQRPLRSSGGFIATEAHRTGFPNNIFRHAVCIAGSLPTRSATSLAAAMRTVRVGPTGDPEI
eukprot:4902398-Alexandrium_andersonii.AAC.1